MKKKCYRCKWYENGKRGTGFLSRTAYGMFDVTKAEAMLEEKKRQPVPLTHRAMLHMMARDGYREAVYKPHLEHVDRKKPGIMITLEGVPGIRHYVIEGFHRLVSNFDAGTDWQVYVLTPAETRSIIWRERRKPRAKAKAGRKSR